MYTLVPPTPTFFVLWISLSTYHLHLISQFILWRWFWIMLTKKKKCLAVIITSTHTNWITHNQHAFNIYRTEGGATNCYQTNATRSKHEPTALRMPPIFEGNVQLLSSKNSSSLPELKFLICNQILSPKPASCLLIPCKQNSQFLLTLGASRYADTAQQNDNIWTINSFNALEISTLLLHVLSFSLHYLLKRYQTKTNNNTTCHRQRHRCGWCPSWHHWRMVTVTGSFVVIS